MTVTEIDWDAVRLVVFDLDGTLYDQRDMRRRMLRALIRDAALTRSLTNFRILRSFRSVREAISEQELLGFEDLTITRTAEMTHIPRERVQAIVSQWIDQRPIEHIRACRYPRVDELFASLKQHGKMIGVFSDYPGTAKLHAMELHADHVIYAGDPDVGLLKPNPRGLKVLMNKAGVSPSETLMVGDRVERDGLAAKRANVSALIRSDRSAPGWVSFSGYSDPIFEPLYSR